MVLQSPVFCGEALVDAYLVDAQLSMHSEDWDAAEAKLTKVRQAPCLLFVGGVM